MDFEQNKVSQDDLENVSGGNIIETKDGKFVILPPRAKTFDKKEDAEKAEAAFKARLYTRKPGGHAHGPGCGHCGPHGPHGHHGPLSQNHQ